MHKRKHTSFFLLLGIFLALPAFASAHGAESATRLSAAMLGESDYARIRETRTASPAELLSSFLVDGRAPAYDETSRTFLYSLIAGGTYDPVIGFSCADSSARIVCCGSMPSALSIRENQSLLLMVYTAGAYSEYRLAFTTLPILEIKTLLAAENPDVPIGTSSGQIQITLFDNRAGISRRVTGSQGLARIRGVSSTKYPQKSYRLTLVLSMDGKLEKRNLPLLGMRPDDDWILYAPYNDPEKCRAALATNLWWAFGAQNNSFGIAAGTQCQFVEVLINGRYWGIYALMHPIDAKQLDLAESGDPLKSEYVYRSISYDATTPEMFQAASEANLAGKYELFEPDAPMDTYWKWAPLDLYLQMLAGEDEAFLRLFPQAVDMDNAIDIWLFLNITQAIDNDGKNMYHIAKLREGKYIMLFAPWDLDQTWGNVWTGQGELLTAVQDDFGALIFPTSMGISRALSLHMDGLAERIRARYEQLRASLLSNISLERLLAQYEVQIYGSGAILRDHSRWPNAAFAAGASGFEQLVMRRMQTVDKCLPTLN